LTVTVIPGHARWARCAGLTLLDLVDRITQARGCSRSGARAKRMAPEATASQHDATETVDFTYAFVRKVLVHIVCFTPS